MSRMSWMRPPPVVMIAGNEPLLRDREIKHAIYRTAQDGRRIVRAESDGEVQDALLMASTFGDAALIVVHASSVEAETIAAFKESPTPKTCILIFYPGAPKDQYESMKLVHGGHTVVHNRPEKKRDYRRWAAKFVMMESDRLLGGRKTIDKNLAEALVDAAGTDLGVLSFELSKMTALARSQGAKRLSLEHIRAMIRASSDVDMEPLREAMRNRDATAAAKVLYRIRRSSGSDPVMLLLRAKGGPAHLAVTWLSVCLMIRQGSSKSEISSRLSIPGWVLENQVIPAAQRWGPTRLRELIHKMAQADRGVLQGAPSPWVSVETAILLGCGDQR